MKKNDTYKENFKFSQSQVVKFCSLIGDLNPIHLDEDFAKKTRFKKTILPGFLSGSIFSKTLGMKFPGTGTIYLYQSMKFLKPMFTETIYTVYLKILDIDYEKKIALISTEIYHDKEKFIEGRARITNKKIK